MRWHHANLHRSGGIHFLAIVLFVATWSATSGVAAKTILVIGPHPDDESRKDR
jgi:hypothetical protein